MRILFHKSANYIGGPGGFLASLALLIALLFGETLPTEEAYAELGHAVALLSVLGSAMCAGYLAFFVLRIHSGDPGSWTTVPASSESSVSGMGTEPGEDWPLLAALLFGGIPVLFAGLAGWVEARA